MFVQEEKHVVSSNGYKEMKSKREEKRVVCVCVCACVCEFGESIKLYPHY